MVEAQVVEAQVVLKANPPKAKPKSSGKAGAATKPWYGPHNPT